MELKQHPLSAAFPAMSADDFQALKDDIEVNGQREPVMVFEGMVLDGWHRYRACCELGLKPQQFTFPEGDDPVAFVKGLNLHRRHLTASQRAAAVVACSAWAPASRPKKGAPGAPFSTKADLAREAHVSESTIAQAKVAHRAGLTDAIASGAMTVKEAAQVARGKPAKAPAPPPAATPAPTPAPESFGPSDDELAEAQREQEAEFAAFRLVLEADDQLAAAVAEVKRLTALVRVLEERNNGLMNEKNAALQAAKSWQRKAEKAIRGVAA
jgi:hypothetical protein